MRESYVFHLYFLHHHRRPCASNLRDPISDYSRHTVTVKLAVGVGRYIYTVVRTVISMCYVRTSVPDARVRVTHTLRSSLQ